MTVSRGWPHAEAARGLAQTDRADTALRAHFSRKMRVSGFDQGGPELAMMEPNWCLRSVVTSSYTPNQNGNFEIPVHLRSGKRPERGLRPFAPGQLELLPALTPALPASTWVVMGKQYNKVEKRRRRHDYLRRKKAAAKNTKR
jgi:hypothetical protein